MRPRWCQRVRVLDAFNPVAARMSEVVTTLPLLILFIGIGAITMLAGSFSRTAARAIGWGTAFALVAYALDYLAQVWGLAEPRGPLSVMHWYRLATILGSGSAPASTWIVLSLVAVSTTALAVAVSSRREVAP